MFMYRAISFQILALRGCLVCVIDLTHPSLITIK